ncbi:MAG: hypothetical protein ACRD4Q_06210 [Candidatus Acidiferrales bacterium]
MNSPTWGTGEINGDLTFNGTSQYVTTPPNLMGTGAATFSAWLYPMALGSEYFSGKVMVEALNARYSGMAPTISVVRTIPLVPLPPPMR